ncbi:AHH domain-containing protein [Streptomyces sp. NPDC059695]|uniref:AHH domain-containing protein n=1 Tax=Streptomyces sp. NPDC059695 TaxID=3346910 RepID=UPI0036BCC8DE
MNAPTEVTPVTAAETAASGVAYRRLHPPASVEFTGPGERPAYDTRLEELLLRAVARAVDEDDRNAGIAGPRPTGPTAVGTTETGSPVESALSARGHLTFAMAVSEPEDGGEGAAGAGEEGKERAGRETAGDGPGETGTQDTRETAEPGEPPAHKDRTSGTATGEDTATSPPATSAASTTPTPTTITPTAGTTPTSGTSPSPEQTSPQPAAPAPGTDRAPWTTPEEAAAAEEGGTEDVSLAATGRTRRETGVTVVTDPQSQVVEGPSPVDGRAVMVIGATQLVLLGEATRYARSRSLIHAVQLGDHIFGARSFVVLEGSLGTSESYFLAVATAPTVTDETVGRPVANWELEGQKISTFTGFRVLPFISTTDGHRYAVNLLWTKERGWVWGDSDEGRRWIRMSRSPREFWLSAEELKLLTFQELDRLVTSGLAGNDEDLEKAAAQLAEMSAKAFALVDEATREKYLEVLVKAWTFEEHRRAIIQIMISLEGLSQLQAVRDRLIQAGLYEQLFADMGGELWELLTAVGEKFGGEKPLTTGEFVDLVAEAMNLTMRHDAGLGHNVEGEQTAVIGLKQAIEIEEAVRAVMGFVLGTLESLKIMLTQPEKILSGLWALHELAVTCYLARFRDPVSMRRLNDLLTHVGKALVHGLRGAAIFGVGPRALTRIKWAVIIEALTWMSEIQAVVEALAKIEKLVSILRFLKMVKAFEGERIAARFTRLAEALHAGSAVLRGLKDEHAVVDLMLLLPEEDGIRLGAVLQEVDIPQGTHLAALMEHPRIGPVLAELRPKAEVLGVLGAKSGGLTPELAQTFARLTGKDGFEIAEVSRVVDALQDGEGARFAKTLEQIGFGRIGPRAQVKADLLALLAGDSRRMEAVHQYGIAVVGQMHARSGGSAEAFDALLAKLEKLRAQHMADGRAVEFAELVEKLSQGKKGAWRRVDRPPKVPRVKATAAERAPVTQRIKELRKRFPKGEVENPKAMENALRQIARTAETDPAKAMEQLDKFEDLVRAEATTEGHVADIMAEAEGKATREAKALHHEAEEAPAQALGARDELRSKTGVAGSPSHELKESMERVGQHQDFGNPAHHVVAASDVRAEVPRAILEEVGINPADDPLNGVYLPRTSIDPKIVPQGWTRHEVLHTDNYYKWITQTLVEARKEGGADGVIRALSEIKEKLLSGKHLPRDVGVPHESYVEWFAKYRHNLDWLTDAEQLELLDRLRAAKQRKRAPRVTRRAGPRGTAADAGPQPRPPETAKARPEARTKPEPTAEPTPRQKAEAGPGAGAEAALKPEAETVPGAKSKGKARAKAEAKVAKAEGKSKAKSKTEKKSKAKPEPKPEATAEAKPEAEPKPEAMAEAKPEPEAKPEVEAKPEATADAEPDPDARPRIDIEDDPVAAAAAGRRVRVDPSPRRPKPRYRVDPAPPTRVAPQAGEDVVGEPLYESESPGEAPQPERKKKRAHRRGGPGT